MSENILTVQTKLWNKNYLLVFISVIFIFSNFYLLMSCMPYAVKDLMHINTEQMSWIVSIYSLGIVLMRPLSGYISDKIGKRKIAFSLFILFSICTVTYLDISSFYILLLIRFIHGLAHSLSTTAHAAMAVDFSPTSMKGQGIGYYGLGMCLAMVIAPALGFYILKHYNYHALIIAASFFSCAGTAITYFIQKDLKNATHSCTTFSVKEMIELKAVPASILGFMISIAYSGILAFIAVYLNERMIENGSIFFYISFAVTMILSRPIIGQLIDRKGSSILLKPALILFSVGMLLVGYSSNLTTILFAAIIIGISYGTVFPSIQTIAVKASPKHKSGSAIGTFFLFYDLGFGIGAILLAKLVIMVGYSNMYLVLAAFIFFIFLCYLFMNNKKIIE